jgi:signal recognition particle subunit SEC65
MTELDVDNMDFDLPNVKPVQIQPADTKMWTIVYPIYFDSLAPKHRRVPLDKASPDPDLAAVIEAAQKLGIPCAVERKKHPADPFRIGRLRIQTSMSKTELLLQLALHLKETIKQQPQRRLEALEYMKQQVKLSQPGAMLAEPSRGLKVAQAMGALGKVPVDLTQFEAIQQPKAIKSKKK